MKNLIKKNWRLLFFMAGIFFVFFLQPLYSRNEKAKEFNFQFEVAAEESAVSAFDEDQYRNIPVKIQEAMTKKERHSFLIDATTEFRARRIFIEIDEDGNVIKPDNNKKNTIDQAKNNLQEEAARVAREFLDKNITRVKVNGKELRIDTDCSYFVRAVYWKASKEKIDLFRDAAASGAVAGNVSSGVELLGTYFKKKFRYSKNKAKVGDIIIFDNTFDKNSNRRRDDNFTHTGVVLKVRDDHTVEFIHGNVSRRVQYGYLNVSKPGVVSENGKQYNSYLRARYSWDKDPKVLTGQLTNGFGGF